MHNFSFLSRESSKRIQCGEPDFYRSQPREFSGLPPRPGPGTRTQAPRQACRIADQQGSPLLISPGKGGAAYFERSPHRPQPPEAIRQRRIVEYGRYADPACRRERAAPLPASTSLFEASRGDGRRAECHREEERIDVYLSSDPVDTAVATSAPHGPIPERFPVLPQTQRSEKLRRLDR
jgi:hypothetical protein